MPLDFEGFKHELREDLVDAMKNEVRSVLESELGFFKSEVLTLKSGLEEFKNTTKSEIAELRSMLVSAEQSPSTCRKVDALVQTKCSVQVSDSRNINISITLCKSNPHT